jgi:site-specific recombinase XerD
MKLGAAIREYIDHKHSLGMAISGDAARLVAFSRQLGDLELNSISVEDVQAYLKGKRGGAITRFWFMKYHALDRFFRYVVSRRYMEHGAPLPATQPKKPASLIPYLYCVEEVRRLLSVGDACYQPTSPLEPHTMRTLILLLYGAGLRICEALKLTLANMNLNDGLLTIRESKFLKSRLVPIGCDLTKALQVYYERQWAASDPASDSPFLRTRKHTPVKFFQANYVFDWLRTEAGIMRFDGGRFQPRLHDFRHTFAVRRLITWYREGKDVQRLLPHLSTYLGHVNIDSTAHYLTMTRELLQEANHRFEVYVSGEVRHG